MAKKLSIVVPVYNEGSGVLAAFDAINEVCRSELPDWDWEIIFVDDGSRDDSFFHLESICEKHRNAMAIRLAANCGSHRAIRAGMEYAEGDAACFLPCDLQEPPELIPRLLQALTDATPVVLAVRSSRQDRWASRMLSRMFFLLARLLISRRMPANGIGTFLLGSRALKVMTRYKERNLTLGGLLMNMGFPYACVPYDRQARHIGETKWTLSKRLDLFVNYFVANSYTPIRLMSWLGIVVALLGFLWAIVVVVNWFCFSSPPTGWTYLFVAVLVLGGIQMTMTGIIGEYVWRALDESRARPVYVVDRVVNQRKPAKERAENCQRAVTRPGEHPADDSAGTTPNTFGKS
jgi:dolichol-phosphate mannosyltransferase